MSFTVQTTELSKPHLITTHLFGRGQNSVVVAKVNFLNNNWTWF